MPRIIKFIELIGRIVVTRGCESGENRDLLFNGHQVFTPREDEKILEMDAGDGRTTI